MRTTTTNTNNKRPHSCTSPRRWSVAGFFASQVSPLLCVSLHPLPPFRQHACQFSSAPHENHTANMNKDNQNDDRNNHDQQHAHGAEPQLPFELYTLKPSNIKAKNPQTMRIPVSGCPAMVIMLRFAQTCANECGSFM